MTLRNLKFSAIAFGLAVGLAGCMAGGKLKDSTHVAVLPDTVKNLWVGKTHNWTKGGIYHSANGYFQSLWDGGVGVGTYTLAANGDLCRKAYYLSDEGDGKFYPDNSGKGDNCVWHSQAADGKIWINDTIRKTASARQSTWWFIEPGEDKVVAGNQIAKQINAIVRRDAIFPAAVAAIPTMKAINTRAEFVAQMTGKKLWYSKDEFLIKSASGTYTATSGGKEYVADWEWKGDMMCRTFRHNGKSDCKRFRGNGTYFQVFNDNGEGSFEFYSTKR